MAINFGNTYMEGSIEPSVKVQAPVQDNSGAVLASALAPAANAIGGMVGSIFKGQQDAANSKFLVDYEMELLDLADAVDQGMDKTRATLLARNLRRKYLGMAPGLQDDFDGIWTKFATSNGLGHVVIEGTEEYQRQQKVYDAAAALGYTPEEYNLYTSRVRQATEINYELDRLQKTGQVITEAQKLQGLQALVGLQDAAYPVAQRRINEAMAEMQANPANKAAILAEITQEIGTQIANIKHAAGSADSAYITAPIEQAMTTLTAWANGEVEVGVVENQLKQTEQMIRLMYMSDPRAAKAIVGSKIIGEIGMHNSTLFTDLFNAETIDVFRRLANDEKVDFLSQNSGITNSVEAVKTAAATIDPNDAEANQQVMDFVNQAVDSVYRNERNADGPMAYKEVIELLGSPEVRAVIERNGGISAQYQKQFSGVLAQVYDNELLAAANFFLDNTTVTTVQYPDQGDGRANPFAIGGPREVPVSGPVRDFIEPRWNGNAVEFVPKAGYETNTEVVRMANEATTGSNSIGDPLNALIRAHANVAGLDPKQVYEENFAERLFGNQTAAPTEQELNLGTEPAEEGEVDEVSSIVNEAVANPDQLTALASFQGDTTNAAVAAIESNFNLSDFAENPIDVRENIMAYAPTNFNPVSLVPGEDGKYDILGLLKGTGSTEEIEHDHDHGDIGVKFASGVDDRVDPRVINTWARVQERFGSQLKIVSGFRDPGRNARAGGAKRSQHMHGNAIDIETGHLSHAERLELIKIASEMGFTGIGVYNNNLHFDMGGRRAWGPNYRGNSVPSWARATINQHLRG